MKLILFHEYFSALVKLNTSIFQLFQNSSSDYRFFLLADARSLKIPHLIAY